MINCELLIDRYTRRRNGRWPNSNVAMKALRSAIARDGGGEASIVEIFVMREIPIRTHLMMPDMRYLGIFSVEMVM